YGSPRSSSNFLAKDAGGNGQAAASSAGEGSQSIPTYRGPCPACVRAAGPVRKQWLIEVPGPSKPLAQLPKRAIPFQRRNFVGLHHRRDGFFIRNRDGEWKALRSEEHTSELQSLTNL